MMFRRTFCALAVVVMLVAGVSPALTQAQTQLAAGDPFVRRSGATLSLEGRRFTFAGANNYYLMYKPAAMVDDVLNDAAAAGFKVVRMWGSLEIGNQDGSNSIHGKADGVFFQYWDPVAGRPAYNDGADGLEKLDYAIYRAGQLGLKVVIPFVNNWNAFGGMDQYVRWANGQYHDDFYRDPTIRQWYKDWIAHLLNRTNIYTGVQYKMDPTIMTWELANEPRCLSAGAYPRSPDCTTATLIAWADEISSYVKSLDANHLVSVGDEGFYCIPGATDWTENCGEGVDTIAFTQLPNVDVMSFHLYPDHWGKSPGWGIPWIQRHIKDARRLGKPAMLGEFGLLDKNSRNVVYKQWTDAVLAMGGAGALYWILSGLEGDGLYPDYDGFTVYCPSPVCTTISNFARILANKRVIATLPPVADDDSAVTEFETSIILNPPANDVAYNGATVVADSLDLDPGTPDQQTSVTVYGGTFTWQPGGTVLFTPAANFSGKAQGAYTIEDSAGHLSNSASLSVTVKPNPSGALTLFSFETGVEGWASASWQSNAGTVEQSTEFATDGSHGLRVITADGGWFGATFATPVDLTGKTKVKLDIQTGAAGTSQNVALQLGDSWTWCQGSWGWINSGTTTTVELDLLSLGCVAPDLSKLQGMYVWFSGGGTFAMDFVRAE